MPESLKNKVCLITGGTSGVGRATALGLARLGAQVMIVGRNPQHGQEALDEIEKKSGNSEVELLLADLSLQAEVRRLAASVQRRVDRLDILANCAGILMLRRSLTSESIETTLASDYLCHFLLTRLLLDMLLRSAPARVITVAGGPGVLRRGRINLDDLQMEKKYNGVKVAVQAALARVYFTFELARRLQGSTVTANAFYPGLIKSNLDRHLPWPLKVWARIGQPFLHAECPTSVFLASSSAAAGVSGRLFAHSRPVQFPFGPEDQETATRLWEISEALTGLSEPFPNGAFVSPGNAAPGRKPPRP